jgi:2-polyprenyl-3-methyl-5-hydroxy-6-metoxy-1,4-benzoquinol methylase
VKEEAVQGDPNSAEGGSPYLPSEMTGLKKRLSQRKFEAAYHVWKRAIRKHSSGETLSRILEVGCGPGNFALCLEKWFPDSQVMALDLEDDLIRFASRRVHSAHFVRASSEKIPLHAHSVDVVSALQVIEHFSTPEDFLAEVARILRPGGLLLLSTPNPQGLGARLQGENWQGIRDDHISLRSPAQWQAALGEEGFERLSEGTTLFNGVPVLGRFPISLPFQVVQAAAGWFPWRWGESYMAVARSSG